MRIDCTPTAALGMKKISCRNLEGEREELEQMISRREEGAGRSRRIRMGWGECGGTNHGHGWGGVVTKVERRKEARDINGLCI